MIPLNLFGLEKKTMTDAVIKCLKHINKVSNSNMVHNADDLLAGKEIEVSVDWIGENENRIPPQKFKVSY